MGAEMTDQSFGIDSYFGTTTRPAPSKHDLTRQEQMIQALLGRDVEEAVYRTFRQWNLTVRDHVRNETGLRLSVGDEQTAVPVRVMDGLPAPLRAIVDEFSNEMLWWLTLHRAQLKGTQKGLDLLGARHDDLVALLGSTAVDAPSLSEIHRLRDFIGRLLDEERVAELLRRIAQINTDVLGAYFFRVPEVRLYWMAIGIFSGLFGLSVEGLTIVTLAHELAHAYTHRGRDIDRADWPTEAFAATDKLIVEGLAQFYTRAICRLLQERQPAALAAFEALLKHQPAPYTGFQEWVSDGKRGGEIVRAAMIEFRLTGAIDHERYRGMISNAMQRIG